MIQEKPSLHDKRDVAAAFRTRLDILVSRSSMSRSAFAKSLHLDRSALTQMLSASTVRLPRAETLIRIANVHHVSLDWLMGISQDENVNAQLAEALKLEEAQEGAEEGLLLGWHRDAAGTKIRYVPENIPDLFRTDEAIIHRNAETGRDPDTQIERVHAYLETSRKLQSDMEICMPAQNIIGLAEGTGVWRGLAPALRQAQLARMAQLTEELYPRLRLFIYDGQKHFCAPYTIFGTQRAALYIGDMYVVLNTADAINRMTAHFDRLIRNTKIHAHESAHWIKSFSTANMVRE